MVANFTITSNGRTAGMTQPNADLQEAVIRKAYARAKLDFADTDYVECHGTGTSVGDPIEVAAIARSFSRQGPPMLIGGVSPPSLSFKLWRVLLTW